MPITGVITLSVGLSAKLRTAFSNALMRLGQGGLLGAAAPIFNLLFHPGTRGSIFPVDSSDDAGELSILTAADGLAA